jgi:hypothetical protein
LAFLTAAFAFLTAAVAAQFDVPVVGSVAGFDLDRQFHLQYHRLFVALFVVPVTAEFGTPHGQFVRDGALLVALLLAVVRFLLGVH